MVQNFQSSFIPKESPTEEVFKKKKVGMAGVLAISLFVSAIVVAGGLYFYKGIVKSDLKSLELELSEAEKNIDKKTINELDLFSKKLNVAKAIVTKHQVVSKFLENLASSTVSSVQFTNFNYDNLENGKLTVHLQGKATSYASVALQEEVFSKNEYFKSLAFSNLTLADKGLVSFDLAISVDAKISTYSP